ncbi:thioredoxin domain-containing protein [Solemya pervernicosa gill symbiont]|uniref:thioredoxin domain-containing protein n=1 Tax=Solemya pervernicosa gill symbiont TaxID=642797 RepID=UPI0022A93F6B
MPAAPRQRMNERFINIKVDREERPDLDKIYQTAHQLLTNRPGGWPLTMFLTHDAQVPFFGGTYFPREPRYGMPSFADILNQVADFYRDNRSDIDKQNTPLLDALEKINTPHLYSSGSNEITIETLDQAYRELKKSIEPEHGGFGRAPKFPHCTSLERLLRHWSATGDNEALESATFTLRKMALGGLFDHLGGGFCRYSVDNQWMIPHFEKMLYDNGPLLSIYSEAWQITHEPLFRRTAEETARWVIREMQSPEGGYFSTLDADSEGHEGIFYVWHPETIKEVLETEQYELFSRHFGLDRKANFEGSWHLHCYADDETLSKEFMLDIDSVRQQLDGARETLFRLREHRVHPGRDEKVLTAWNGLMIKGMAVAGRIFDNSAFIDSAERALNFIRHNLWKDGRLFASHKDGQARLMGYLDDYAFLLDALLELLQVRWSRNDLDFAIALADVLLEHFEDKENGGFFFTADDHEALIQRPKPLGDESTPAGNGIAAYALNRLGQLLGEERYLNAARRTLDAAAPMISEMPHRHNALLLDVESSVYPSQMLVLRGNEEELRSWQQLVARQYSPRRLAFPIPSDETNLPGALAERTLRGDFTAYLCSGNACSSPITAKGALATLKQQLDTPD